jgi:hypothetical protein
VLEQSEVASNVTTIKAGVDPRALADAIATSLPIAVAQTPTGTLLTFRLFIASAMAALEQELPRLTPEDFDEMRANYLGVHRNDYGPPDVGSNPTICSKSTLVNGAITSTATPRAVAPFKFPYWRVDNEPRPFAFGGPSPVSLGTHTLVEFHTNFLNETENNRFLSYWVSQRGLLQLVVRGHDSNSPMIGFSGVPQPETTGPERAIADQEFVVGFLQSQPSIKKLMCTDAGVALVDQVESALIYSTTISEVVEKLQALDPDLTVDALKKRISRLRKLLDDTELPNSRALLHRIAEGLPEGSADFIQRAARRAGLKYGEFRKKYAARRNGKNPAPAFQPAQFEAGMLE